MAKIASALVAGVDFPGFVAELIDGVFGAIVNASIQQMDAYAKLLADVAKSLDAGDSELPKRLGARRLATNRQQLLATMVMMGINRIAAKS